MIFHQLSRINKEPKGFSTIGVIAVLVITSIIALGAAMATNQVLTQGGKNNDYTTASRHSMNAIHWISRDAQMSQIIEPDGTAGFPLTLGWTKWDNSEHQVVYSIEGDKLIRRYSVDDGEPTETVVAQHINSVSENTSCELTSGVLTLRVTATVGQGLSALSVSKMRQISPRPGL